MFLYKKDTSFLPCCRRPLKTFKTLIYALFSHLSFSNTNWNYFVPCVLILWLLYHNVHLHAKNVIFPKRKKNIYPFLVICIYSERRNKVKRIFRFFILNRKFFSKTGFGYQNPRKTLVLLIWISFLTTILYRIFRFDMKCKLSLGLSWNKTAQVKFFRYLESYYSQVDASFWFYWNPHTHYYSITWLPNFWFYWNCLHLLIQNLVEWNKVNYDVFLFY